MTLDLVLAGGWLPPSSNLDALGLGAMAFGVASSLMRRRGAILACGAVAGTLFGLHYLRLGAHTGAGLCAIAVAQNLAAASLGVRGPSAAVRAGFALSALLALCLGAATWGGWPSAFASAGALAATAARLQADPDRLRAGFVASTACWCVHDFAVGSPCALACELLTLAGFVYALARGRSAPPVEKVPGMAAA